MASATTWAATTTCTTGPLSAARKPAALQGAEHHRRLDSYKFYIPPVQATFNTQLAFRTLEKPISQEIFTVGYYIFTVDGPKVTVDYYAMPNGCGGDCDETYDVIPYAGQHPDQLHFSMGWSRHLR